MSGKDFLGRSQDPVREELESRANEAQDRANETMTSSPTLAGPGDRTAYDDLKEAGETQQDLDNYNQAVQQEAEQGSGDTGNTASSESSGDSGDSGATGDSGE